MFPADPEHKLYWDAAWESYISFNRAYPRVFDALRHEYERAIKQLKSRDGQDVPVPEANLADHLLSMYVYGSLELNDRLFETFMRRAPVSLRKHLLQSAGARSRVRLWATHERGLSSVRCNSGSPVEEAVESRSSVPQELEPFGWWFASARLPQRWAFEQLDFLTSRVYCQSRITSLSSAWRRLQTRSPFSLSSLFGA